LFSRVGCNKFRFVDAVRIAGLEYKRLSRVAVCAVITGYCKSKMG
jgi:hypothetical protein